jgi:hypothetical protein
VRSRPCSGATDSSFEAGEQLLLTQAFEYAATAAGGGPRRGVLLVWKKQALDLTSRQQSERSGVLKELKVAVAQPLTKAEQVLPTDPKRRCAHSVPPASELVTKP